MMTRLILPFLVAFLAAIAGGSALVLVKAKDAHAKAIADLVAKRAKADSAAGHAAAPGADSAAPHDPAGAHPPDSTAAHDAPVGHVAHDSAAAAPPASAPPAKAPTPVTLPPRGKPGAVGPAVDTATRGSAKAPPASTADGKPAVSAAEAAQTLGAEKKLAKIFGSMSPRDAAKVLQQMEDADVRVILGHLGSKQAAAVLGNFPAPRAAELSKQSLKGPIGRGP